LNKFGRKLKRMVACLRVNIGRRYFEYQSKPVILYGVKMFRKRK